MKIEQDFTSVLFHKYLLWLNKILLDKIEKEIIIN
jgi:hypothetical protein